MNDLVTDREIYEREIYERVIDERVIYEREICERVICERVICERVICESVPMATIFSLVGNRRLKRHVRAQSAAHGAIFGDARRPH